MDLKLLPFWLILHKPARAIFCYFCSAVLFDENRYCVTPAKGQYLPNSSVFLVECTVPLARKVIDDFMWGYSLATGVMDRELVRENKNNIKNGSKLACCKLDAVATTGAVSNKSSSNSWIQRGCCPIPIESGFNTCDYANKVLLNKNPQVKVNLTFCHLCDKDNCNSNMSLGPKLWAVLAVLFYSTFWRQ